MKLDEASETWAEAPGPAPAADAGLAELLEAAGAQCDAEQWVRCLQERLATLDLANVRAITASATQGEGLRLEARLEAGSAAAASAAERHARCAALLTGAPEPGGAGGAGVARGDRGQRALLAELTGLYSWLDAPPLQDLEVAELSLSSAEGRSRALARVAALVAARAAERAAPGWARRLAAVQERLRRLARAREALAAQLARHINNLLIHVGNEAAPPPAHHPALLPCAPFMQALRSLDARAHAALLKLYVGTWQRVYERAVRSACDAARAALRTESVDSVPAVLDPLLTQIETLCNNEEDFCIQFFGSEVDTKGDNSSSDGDRSEKSEKSEKSERADVRDVMSQLFAGAEAELCSALKPERTEPFVEVRVFACVGRRVLGDEGGLAGGVGGAGGAGGAGEARWARGLLAAAAVTAKRNADRSVTDRIATFPDYVKQAAKRPRCGELGFTSALEELCAAGAGLRRAELERWALTLGRALLAAVQRAAHPRTPPPALQLENYHSLLNAISALRMPALDALRRETRARYDAALQQYVRAILPRPLDPLAEFFEGVNAAVASGVRADEVCYRAAYSKHELRRRLAACPAPAVRRRLRALRAEAARHLPPGGLRQVAWRALQQSVLAQHRALEEQIATCYPGAGLALPLTTQEVLDAFSEIAREDDD